MSVPKGEAGSRFDGSEVVWLLRDAIRSARHGQPPPGLAVLRTRVAARRADRYLGETEIRFLTMTQAAFILCRSKAYVRSLVTWRELSGDFVPAFESSSGWAHWRIPAKEVRELAEAGLDVDRVAREEEARLERIRSEELEGRAGEPAAEADQAAAERLHQFYEARRGEGPK